MKKLLSIAFLIFFTHLAAAQTPAEQLTKLLGDINSMRANFTQQVLDGKGRVIQKSNGQMALQRPGKFLWNTKHPTQQQLIADGKKVWLYDQDLQQVTTQKQDSQNANSPAMLLSGSISSLTQNFKIALLKRPGNDVGFELKPNKKQAMFRSVTLIFFQGKLKDMRLTDALGQTSLLNFSQVENNPKLATSLFQFKVPAGVDVVQQ